MTEEETRDQELLMNIPPSTWLWQEIERRFGKEAADTLHRDYNAQVRLYARRLAVEPYRRRLPGMRRQLERARKAGQSTKRLEASIALVEQRLREAGEEAPGGTNKTREV